MNARLGGPAMLFCPGNRPDRFVKAHRSADVAILDLEDAVGPEDKDTARTAVASALPALQSAVVRVNSNSSPWHTADVKAVRDAGWCATYGPQGRTCERSRSSHRIRRHRNLRNCGGHFARRRDRRPSPLLGSTLGWRGPHRRSRRPPKPFLCGLLSRGSRSGPLYSATCCGQRREKGN